MAKLTKDSALCTLSGGFDSAAAMLVSLKQRPTAALFVSYGQPYLEAELRAVRSFIAWVMVQDRASVFRENYRGIRYVAADIAGAGGADDPYFPFRNWIIVALAANQAALLETRRVVFGSKSLKHRPDDPVSFLDSTVAFYEHAERLALSITEANDIRLKFELPLAGWSKHAVLAYLHSNAFPLEKLWNCYGSGALPCGECPHCKETLPLLREFGVLV